ncbi:MAG: hypothetical protein ACMUIP_13695 [bacterium]
MKINERSLLLSLIIFVVLNNFAWGTSQKRPIRLFRIGQEHGNFTINNTKYTLRGIYSSFLIPVIKQDKNHIFLSLTYSEGKTYPEKLEYKNFSLDYHAIMLADYFIKPNFKVGISQFKLSHRKENYGLSIGAGFSMGGETGGFFFDPIHIAVHELDGQFPLVYSSKLGICTKF